MRIFQLLLLEKCIPHLSPLTSEGQTSVYARLAFWRSSDELERSKGKQIILKVQRICHMGGKQIITKVAKRVSP